MASSAMGRALLCELQVVLRKLFERLGATYIKLGECMLGYERPSKYDAHACHAAGLNLSERSELRMSIMQANPLQVG